MSFVVLALSAVSLWVQSAGLLAAPAAMRDVGRDMVGAELVLRVQQGLSDCKIRPPRFADNCREYHTCQGGVRAYYEAQDCCYGYWVCTSIKDARDGSPPPFGAPKPAIALRIKPQSSPRTAVSCDYGYCKSGYLCDWDGMCIHNSIYPKQPRE